MRAVVVNGFEGEEFVDRLCRDHFLSDCFRVVAGAIIKGPVEIEVVIAVECAFILLRPRLGRIGIIIATSIAAIVFVSVLATAIACARIISSR